MTANRPAAPANRLALAALAVIAMAGCAAQTGPIDESDLDGDVAVSDAALFRGGGSTRAGYTCGADGTCTCDKSIENDCEDMSGICTDATVDGLITCINGWLTTHCTCTKAAIAKPPSPVYAAPILGGVLTHF